MVSQEFIENHETYLESLGTKHPEIVYYVYQQVEAFRRLMPEIRGHIMAEQMVKTFKDLQKYVNQTSTRKSWSAIDAGRADERVTRPSQRIVA